MQEYLKYCMQVLYKYGKSGLKNANIWNYEFQTQFYGNIIGMFSINAFYKNIERMQQATNGITMAGTEIIESLGINLGSYPLIFRSTKILPIVYILILIHQNQRVSGVLK